MKENFRVRRLTPIECERLQAFPEIERYVTMEICTDLLKNYVSVETKNPKLQSLAGSVEKKDSLENVQFVENNSHLNDQQIKNVALSDVHIFCEDKQVLLGFQEKLYCIANSVEKISLFPPYIDQDGFALTCAGINSTLESATRLGAEASHQKEQCLIAQKNGKMLVNLYGKETTRLAETALKDLIIRREHLKSTISSLFGIENLEQRLITLCCFAIHAIVGFIPKETLRKNTFTITIQSNFGWTRYGKFGDGVKEISDSQRYKCLGNSVTTSVISAVIERVGEHPIEK